MNPRAELEKRYPKAITNLNCALCASQISVIIEVL